ncbi:MAG TPA: zf-TFIIB domain-containing protein [Agromyces sp.]
MKCPKCQSNMEKVRTPEATVDRCTFCRGLWFDLLEYQDVGAKSAKALDIGSSGVGRKYDKFEPVLCPNDGQRMTRMTALGQPHIHYDQCPTCSGVFFDAGEFRDYKTMTIADVFRDLFGREK